MIPSPPDIQRLELLTALVVVGERGATTRELAARLDWTESLVQHRRAPLRRLGLIATAPERRVGTGRHLSPVWVATLQGRRVAAIAWGRTNEH